MLVLRNSQSLYDISSGADFYLKRAQMIDDFRNLSSEDDKLALVSGFDVSRFTEYDAALIAATVEHLCIEAGIAVPDWIDGIVLVPAQYVKAAGSDALRRYIDEHLDGIFAKHGILCDEVVLSRV